MDNIQTVEAVAKIAWAGDRYEMKIDGILKAYTQDDHEAGLAMLKELAEEKGYTVEVEGEN